MSRPRYESALRALAEFHRQRLIAAPTDAIPAIMARAQMFRAAMRLPQGALPILELIGPRFPALLGAAGCCPAKSALPSGGGSADPFLSK